MKTLVRSSILMLKLEDTWMTTCLLKIEMSDLKSEKFVQKSTRSYKNRTRHFIYLKPKLKDQFLKLPTLFLDKINFDLGKLLNIINH